LSGLLLEPPLFAICAQNIRKVPKKVYGPLDLVSSETQTDDANVEWLSSADYVKWRDIETQSADYVEWRAGAHWMEGWHFEARTKACDKAEVEYRLFLERKVDWCEWRDSPAVDSVTDEESGEAAERQPLESDEVIVDVAKARKFLRALKNMH
jgi:hypothetical protein